MNKEEIDFLVRTANFIGSVTLSVEQISFLRDNIETITKERDAAIADLKCSDDCCDFCRHCAEPAVCKKCSITFDNWEWRGITNGENG